MITEGQFLSVLHKNMLWLLGYSLESPCRDDSNEDPQYMFLWRNNKIIPQLSSSTHLICSSVKHPNKIGTL